MSHRVCPWWLGFTLLLPLRRWQYDPTGLLSPYVREGMTVLEPGPGMGFFTLELARLVGPTGRVIAVDIQPQMLSRLKRRAQKAGLVDRLEIRLAKPDSLGVDDATRVDFALAFAMVHEVPDAGSFFTELAHALKKDASVLLAEPKGHVRSSAFEEELQTARRAGLEVVERPRIRTAHAALLRKSGTGS